MGDRVSVGESHLKKSKLVLYVVLEMSMFYHMAKKPRPAPYYAHVSMDPLLTLGEKSSILAFTN